MLITETPGNARVGEHERDATVTWSAQDTEDQFRFLSIAERPGLNKQTELFSLEIGAMFAVFFSFMLRLISAKNRRRVISEVSRSETSA